MSTQNQNEEKARSLRLQAQKDKADLQLPNQGEGFLLSNTGTDAKFVEAREMLEREKEQAKNRPATNKNKWIGGGGPPTPKQPPAGMELTKRPAVEITTEDIQESPEETKQSQPRPGKFNNNNNNNEEQQKPLRGVREELENKTNKSKKKD